VAEEALPDSDEEEDEIYGKRSHTRSFLDTIGSTSTHAESLSTMDNSFIKSEKASGKFEYHVSNSRRRPAS